MLAFVSGLMLLRKDHPIFRRERRFFQGHSLRGDGVKDIVWLNPDGVEMSEAEWNQSFARCLGVYMSGDTFRETDAYGRPLQDDDFLLLRGDYLRIDTKGTQYQYWYGNADAPDAVAGDFIADIPDKITSEQFSVTLFFTHRF